MSLTIKFSDYPTIVFAEEAWDRMWYLVDNVSTEVGWLGRVVRTSPFGFRIEEVFVPPQDVNGATTEMQPDDLAKFLMGLQDERHPGIVNEVTAWLHSHSSMGITRSGQDMTQWGKWKDGFAKQGLPSIAGRANKKGDIECELYLPEFGLEIEGIVPTLEALPEVRQPWQDDMDSLIKANVRPKVYKPASYNWSGAGKNGGYQGSSQPVDYRTGSKQAPSGKLLGGGGKAVASHAERTKLASEYGLLHYNALTSDEQKRAWMELTEDIFELLQEAMNWGTLEIVRFDIANAMQDYQTEDILTVEGERFMLDTALEEELTGGYRPQFGGRM